MRPVKADAVAPERREGWVAQRVEEGVDVLVCHPWLAQTGLDLVDFPTICWYETEFSVFQSTRKAALLVGREPARTWPIGDSRHSSPSSSRVAATCRRLRGCTGAVDRLVQQTQVAHREISYLRVAARSWQPVA